MYEFLFVRGKRTYAVCYSTVFDTLSECWWIMYGSSIYRTTDQETLQHEITNAPLEWQKECTGIQNTARQRYLHRPRQVELILNGIPKDERLTRSNLKLLLEYPRFWKSCLGKFGVRGEKPPDVTDADDDIEDAAAQPLDVAVATKQIQCTPNRLVTHRRYADLKMQIRKNLHFSVQDQTRTVDYFICYRRLETGEVMYGYSIGILTEDDALSEMGIAEHDHHWQVARMRLRTVPRITFISDDACADVGFSSLLHR